MYWILYYIVTLLANIALLVIFGKSLSLSTTSLVPVCLIAISAFQSIYFKNVKTDSGFSTAYGSGLNVMEENELMRYASCSLLAIIPFLVPFVFFFGIYAKLFSVFVYIFGFALGLVVYRIKNKDKLKRRIDRQNETENTKCEYK